MDVYLRRLLDAIQSATRGLTAEDLARRPTEGKWSVAEILEHLSLTYAGTIRNIARSLEAEKPLERMPTLKQRLVNLAVLECGYFPSGRKSPEAAIPKGISSSTVLAEINAKIGEMDEAIQRCENKFGRRTIVNEHPILGPFTMQQWRKFHWAHGKHHVKQIMGMRRRP